MHPWLLVLCILCVFQAQAWNLPKITPQIPDSSQFRTGPNPNMDSLGSSQRSDSSKNPSATPSIQEVNPFDPTRKGISGLPSIDTLPNEEWVIESPDRKSYVQGLGLGLLVPGGAQLYTRHYVRAGFLIGLEGYLLSEVLVNSRLRTNNRSDNAKRALERAQNYLDSMLNQSPDHPNQAEWKGNFRSEVLFSRTELDLAEENRGLWISQAAWLGGLHLYGLLDGYQAIRRNNQAPTHSKKNVFTAVMLSALIPGGGQIYNGSPGKAGLLYMAYLGSYASFGARQHTVEHYEARKQLALAEGDASGTAEMAEKATFFRKKRNQYIWAPMLFYFYSLGDAAVDAHLSDFDHPDHLARQQKWRIDPFSPWGDPGVQLSLSF